MASKIFLLLFIGCCVVFASKSYEGYKVFRVWPRTELQRIYLRSLENEDGFDFWSDVTKIDLPVDIMVNPENELELKEKMRAIGLDASVFIDDLGEKLKSQKVGDLKGSGMTWTEYYTIEDIYAWLDELAVKYPDRVNIEIAGSSFEGRKIKGLKISFGSGKKSVFFEGTHHAREWISPATLTYITNEILTSTDPGFRRIAEAFDWYIFPVTNPDGYSYSHTNDRMWRKTRTYYSETCRGADPNRNWDIYWGVAGSSKVCTSNTFQGSKPFSENSTASLSQYITKVSSSMVAYFSFHSFSQLLMVPYGHTTDPLSNYNETVAIARVAAQALSKRYGTQYRVGNIAETLYLMSGNSVDWVKDQFQTPLVYLYELRDRGTHGFILPPEQIIPNCEEIMDSLIALFEEAEKRGIVSLK